MFPLCYQDILTFWKQLSKTAKVLIFPSKSIVNGSQGDDVTVRRASNPIVWGAGHFFLPVFPEIPKTLRFAAACTAYSILANKTSVLDCIYCILCNKDLSFILYEANARLQQEAKVDSQIQYYLSDLE